MVRKKVLLTHLLNRNKQSLFSSQKIDQTNLEWQTWSGSLPNGAVSVYNGYARRIDYVCKCKCEASFYNPDKRPYCNYPYAEKENVCSSFEILVNKDNFEFLEWKDDSYGSVPPNSVKTCPGNDKYVGKNKYGLGKVIPKDKAFFLPWEGKEYWYKHYQVLTFNKDITSEHISDVKYRIDEAKIHKYPAETMSKSTITNNACHPVSKTVTLSKTTQVVTKWDTSFSLTRLACQD